MTTINQDLWEVASVVAMLRLGLVPLRRVNGTIQPPKKDLAAMPPDEAKKARRKYRKMWRRELAKTLREFEKLPKRRQKSVYSWGGNYVKGRWKSVDDDPLGVMLLEIEKVEVGEKPSAWARGYRWASVKNCEAFQKELIKAARELGLMHRKRSI